jgi:pimeloyl-ACP methyl ester carboxylesterase
MVRRGFVGAIVVALAAVSSSLSAASATSVPTPPTSCQNALLEGGSRKPAPKGGWVPVLLVHGITSSRAAWRETPIGGGASIADQLARIPGSAIYTFDYSKNSLDWVTSPLIAPELTSAVDCLAHASSHQVIVVAHSMGGLAAQQAQAAVPAGEISRVITVGTPVKGSFLLSAASAVDADATTISPAESAWVRLLTKVCGASGTATPDSNTCGPLSSVETAAGKAMMPSSVELAALPAWQKGIVVQRLAARLDVSLAGKNRDIGDGVVAVSSATAGGTVSSYVDTCHDVPVTKVLSSECTHGHELRNRALLAQVLAGARKTIRAATPIKRLQAESELRALTQGSNIVLVDVPGGYDAAAYDQSSHINFWEYRASSWKQAGVSEYPGEAGTTGYLPYDRPVTVSGALLTNAEHATFIVDGPFTGDGSGEAVAYANGPQGWGLVLARSDGTLASSGHGYENQGPGRELTMGFSDGQFVTYTGSVLPSTAFGAGVPIVRHWRWVTDHFELDHDNIFESAPADTPPSAYTMQPLPADSPPDGLWGARITNVESVGTPDAPAYRLELQPGPAQPGSCGPATCGFSGGVTQRFTTTADPSVMVVLPVREGAGVSYITAPNWVLNLPVSRTHLPSDFERNPVTFSSLAARGENSWYVPASLGVHELLLQFGPKAELLYEGGRLARITLVYDLS